MRIIAVCRISPQFFDSASLERRLPRVVGCWGRSTHAKRGFYRLIAYRLTLVAYWQLIIGALWISIVFVLTVQTESPLGKLQHLIRSIWRVIILCLVQLLAELIVRKLVLFDFFLIHDIVHRFKTFDVVSLRLLRLHGAVGELETLASVGLVVLRVERAAKSYIRLTAEAVRRLTVLLLIV